MTPHAQAVKAVGSATIASLMLADEILPSWAEKSSLMASIAILAGLLLYVIPAVAKYLVDNFKQMQMAHSADLERLSARQSADNEKLTNELKRAIESQTNNIVNAVKQSK